VPGPGLGQGLFLGEERFHVAVVLSAQFVLGGTTRIVVLGVSRGVLTALFPGVPVWRGLAGWLALVGSGDGGGDLVLVESPADLALRMAIEIRPASLPLTAADSCSPPMNRIH
jgi:hypothetical protein